MQKQKRNVLFTIVSLAAIISLASCDISIKISNNSSANSTSEEESISTEETASEIEANSEEITSEEGTSEIVYVPVTSMSIDIENFNIIEGSTKQLSIDFSPLNATYTDVTWISSNEDAVTINKNGLITAKAKGRATVTCTLVNNTNITSTVDISVQSDGEGFIKRSMNADCQDLNRYYSASLGEQNVLIIPIHFSDGPYSGCWTNSQLKTVDDTIFDTSDPESYVSYYKSVSYDRLTLSGEVSKVYQATYGTSDFDDENTARNNLLDMFDSATKWVDANDDNIDIKKDYDQNKDGYIDNIHFIVDGDDQDEWGSYIWPHMSQTGNYPGDAGEFPTVNTYSLSNLGHFDDAYTTIHEQGHIFGLQDYYNYSDVGKYNYYDLVGGADMQDIGLLDWNIYSKMNMGWVDPYYFDDTEESSTITIGPAATTGDCIVLGQSWNGNAFDEYITIELFSEVGVNSLTWDDYEYHTGMNLGTGGVRISHVDSRLIGYSYNESLDKWEYGKADSVFDEGYEAYGLRYTNSFDSNDYNGYVIDNDNYKLLQVMEADGLNQFGEIQHSSNISYLSSSDFFKTGDSFSMAEYSNFFFNETTLNNGDEFPYEIEFNSVSFNEATITVTKK